MPATAATTPPLAVVLRSEPVTPVRPSVVVVAFVPNKLFAESAVDDAYANCDVDDAKSPVRNQVGVEVAFVVVAKLERRE